MSTTIDFNVVPAKAKCSKCGVEEEIPLKKNIKLFYDFMKKFDETHKDCK